MAPLKDRVLDEIRGQGPMTVARFMELALYDPEEGYYAAGPRRAGEEWLTGPTLHPVFGWTLARGLAPLLAQVDEPTLVEAGTGSGELTRDLCYGLHEHAPDTFAKLALVVQDASPTALDRAQGTLEEGDIDLEDVTATRELPDRFEGVLVANELLDALPTHLCQRTEDGVRELLLVEGDPALELVAREPSSPRVREHAQRVGKQAPEGARFEVPIAALDWVRDAAERLEQGALVLVDYGDDREALLAAEPGGTIHAYNQGVRVEAFHHEPGRMDITYRVPFDEVANAAQTAGLDVAVRASQGQVLDALGIRELARSHTGMDTLAAKKLVDPDGAGGTFEILVLTRGIEVGQPWPTR